MDVSSFIQNASKRLAKKEQVAEVDIETPFCTFAKRNGCKALKLIMLNKRGFPDRTILCPGGRILFIEFKRKNKKPRPTQVAVMKMILGLGFEYHVCDQPGQAEAILEDFLAWG